MKIRLDERKFNLEILTKRLKLVPLTEEDIKKSLENLGSFYQAKGYKSKDENLSNMMYKIYNIKLANMKKDPDNYLFYTYWLIIKRNNNQIIGRIGFKNIPNEKGEVEIGYGISIEFRSQGYMTEALNAMVKWGFVQKLLPIKKIVAKTKKDNIPSQKVLKNVGFSFKYNEDEFMCWKKTK